MRKNSSSYPVEVVQDAFGESPVLAKLLEGASRVLLVADMNVVQRTPGLGTKIGHYVQDHGITLAGSPIVLAGGEKIKADNLQTAMGLATSIISAQLKSTDVVLILGGGTLFDVAGWAAAQARGGARIVRMPTTPAAMIDAAFADNAALDLSSVKDALRVPCAPAAVVIDPAFASSVLDGVWRGGMGEAVRYAASTDSALLKKLEKLIPDYVKRAPEAFKSYVDDILASRAKKGASELGLWCGNRLQALSGYKLPNGYAASIGLVVESYAAVVRGKIDDDDLKRVVAILRESGAVDGLYHSQHLLQQPDNLLCGIDAWLLTHPDGLPMLAKLGKTEIVAEPDREVYRQALKLALKESHAA